MIYKLLIYFNSLIKNKYLYEKNINEKNICRENSNHFSFQRKRRRNEETKLCDFGEKRRDEETTIKIQWQRRQKAIMKKILIFGERERELISPNFRNPTFCASHSLSFCYYFQFFKHSVSLGYLGM